MTFQRVTNNQQLPTTMQANAELEAAWPKKQPGGVEKFNKGKKGILENLFSKPRSGSGTGSSKRSQTAKLTLAKLRKMRKPKVKKVKL